MGAREARVDLCVREMRGKLTSATHIAMRLGAAAIAIVLTLGLAGRAAAQSSSASSPDAVLRLDVRGCVEIDGASELLKREVSEVRIATKQGTIGRAV